jgi:hypothetical protein
MKDKVFFSVMLVVTLLLITPVVSGHSASSETIRAIIDNTKKTISLDNGEPSGFELVTIHVYVYYYNGTPCPNASVYIRRWFGLLVHPILLYVLAFPCMILTKKLTDENGRCTFYRPGPIVQTYSSFIIKAGISSKISGTGVIDNVVSGVYEVTIMLKDH